jgi:hypothetical protein
MLRVELCVVFLLLRLFLVSTRLFMTFLITGNLVPYFHVMHSVKMERTFMQTNKQTGTTEMKFKYCFFESLQKKLFLDIRTG